MLEWEAPKRTVQNRSPRVDMVVRNVKKARLRMAYLTVVRTESYVMSSGFPRPLLLNMPKAVIPKTQEQFSELDTAITILHRWTAVASALLNTYGKTTAEYKMLENVLK